MLIFQSPHFKRKRKSSGAVNKYGCILFLIYGDDKFSKRYKPGNYTNRIYKSHADLSLIEVCTEEIDTELHIGLNVLNR